MKDYSQIENKLGIDLITLFNGLEKGVYVKVNNRIYRSWIDYDAAGNEFYVYTFHCEKPIELAAYGRKWALTEKELQGE